MPSQNDCQLMKISAAPCQAVSATAEYTCAAYAPVWTAGTDPKLMCQHSWVMQVLRTEPKNVKALFRRGKAQLRLGNTDGAATDLGAAHRLAPDDAGIDRELRVWMQ